MQETAILRKKRLIELRRIYDAALDLPPGFFVWVETKNQWKVYLSLYYNGEGWADITEPTGGKPDPEGGKALIMSIPLSLTIKTVPDVVEAIRENVKKTFQGLGL